MKNKNFLSKFKPKIPIHLEVEIKLLPRLRFMGYLLLTISLITFTFAMLAPQEEAIHATLPATDHSAFAQEGELSSGISLFTEDTPFELNPTEILNFYVVSIIFAGVGGLLLLTTWRRRKTPPHKQDTREE